MTIATYAVIAIVNAIAGALACFACLSPQKPSRPLERSIVGVFSAGWREGYRVAKAKYERVRDEKTGRFVQGRI